jgi:UDP-glucuronate 4-epimerase
VAERFLVTGALGCIGAWVVRQLVTEGVPAVVFDAGGSTHRLRYLLSDEELARVTLVKGDISDGQAVRDVVKEHRITNVIHLAALQVPFCKADPPLGAAVNVLGTVNVFEAVKGAGSVAGPVVYASSIAAYGGSDDGKAPADPTGLPATHYGVYKRANEGNAHVYWLDDQVPSIGLRPYVVYGVGRDQGMTSAPTVAMLAAAQGRPFHIPFGGRSQLHYAADAADAFVRAARSGQRGAAVFNLAGPAVHMREVVEAITDAAPEVAGKVTFDDAQLPFPEEVDSGPLVEAIGAPRLTTLTDGTAETVRRFRALTEAGVIDAPSPP